MKDQETLGSMTYLEKEPNILGLQMLTTLRSMNLSRTSMIVGNRMMTEGTSGMVSQRIIGSMEQMLSLGMELVM